jgi:chorismate synthase
VTWEQVRKLYDQNEILLNCVDPETEKSMQAEVDAALRSGDSVGGVFEVVAHHVPPGLGTVANWDERLDTKLAAAVMSLQAVKAVEIGDGVAAAFLPGSQVHDQIGWDRSKVLPVPAPSFANNPEKIGMVAPEADEARYTGFVRHSNRAGGIEGGMSNGQDVIVRGYLKPISTLRRPLESVDFATRQTVKASYERSDVCVLPAAGVAGEAMVALVLAGCVLEKFGGDSIDELRRNFAGYCEQLRNY